MAKAIKATNAKEAMFLRHLALHNKASLLLSNIIPIKERAIENANKSKNIFSQIKKMASL
jgi:hypothetical protein